MNDLVALALSDASIVNIIVVLLVLTLIPTILLMMTSFTRIVIVLSFTRNALGTQQMPPNQVMIGLALILTLFVMGPTFTEIKETAIDPYMEEQMDIFEALDIAEAPLREFMFRQAETEPKSLNLFLGMAGESVSPESIEEIPLGVLVSAFITSELTKAFRIGFMLYIPFIMIDMIVASILMSMGMMMLPPAMISLPFKLLLFIMVDGWNLIMKTIVYSFR
jgi:flagellar biosynthetic protein FliP